jgi:hypothetical protein
MSMKKRSDAIRKALSQARKKLKPSPRMDSKACALANHAVLRAKKNLRIPRANATPKQRAAAKKLEKETMDVASLFTRTCGSHMRYGMTAKRELRKGK